MPQILILFAHTFWADSKVNKALLESIKDEPNITIHNLGTIYKDYKINIDSEKMLLQKVDKIVFQFPFFWFSTPSLLKEWQDRVLTDILYGSNPNLLENKSFQVITTAGGAESSYDGHHGAGINELLSPLNQSFAYLKLKILEPFVIYSANVANLPLQAYKNALQKI